MASVKQVDQARFHELLANDPEVQAVIRRVWGDGPRPGDTPKNLEKANHAASQEIGAILKAKGVQLPPHTFINPRSGAIEAEHGWAGLPTGVKIAIIAGGTLATAGALGAFGGGAALGSTAMSGSAPMIGSAAATGGNLAGGIGGALAAGGGAAGAGAGAAGAGGLLASSSLLSAAPMVGSAAATGGSLAGGAGAATAGGGGLMSTLSKLATSKGVGAVGNVLGKQQEGAAQGLVQEAQLGQGQDRNAVDLYSAQNQAQNQQANTDLERQKFTDTHRGTTAKQALLAALLGGDYKGSEVSVPGIQNAKVSGGMMDSLKNSPGVMAAMQKLAGQASTAQDTPLAFQGGQPVAAPTLTPLPQQGKGSKMLDALSRIAQVGGAVGAMRGGQ